ncbi:MAG: prepilin peptidase [Acidobacteriaceae bacterium]|nr:prepilin peptidase [Acidobacteriaceae bacterium]
MVSLTVFTFAGFLLGLLFGSFLNVCISRLPAHESVVRPRSRCPRCGAQIRWYDNIPVLSWILLGGLCRDCGEPISVRYPLVELAVGAWFAIQASRLHMLLAAFQAPNSTITTSEAAMNAITLLAVVVMGFLLIGLMVMDWQTHLLPDTFTVIGIVIGLLFVCAQAVFLGPTQDQILLAKQSIRIGTMGGAADTGNVFLTGPEALIGGRILAIGAAALLLLGVRWFYLAARRREGMGLGDVKLFAMIAAFLGFWPAILALFVGVFTASVYGIALLAARRANAASKLPFGSFLAAGALFADLFGDRIIEAYRSLL